MPFKNVEEYKCLRCKQEQLAMNPLANNGTVARMKDCSSVCQNIPKSWKTTYIRDAEKTMGKIHNEIDASIQIARYVQTGHASRHWCAYEWNADNNLDQKKYDVLPVYMYTLDKKAVAYSSEAMLYYKLEKQPTVSINVAGV